MLGLTKALRERGHEVVVVAPSHSRKLVKDSRARIKSAAKAKTVAGLFDSKGDTLAIGAALPFPPAKLGGTAAVPIDVARTLEDLFQIEDGFDFVHVHEPFAPSAASAALRMSFTLNVGTFHQATERTPSTQVARKFVELFFGRLDARTTINTVTKDLVKSYFGGDYTVIGPGADAPHDRPPKAEGASTEIVIDGVEERAAQRILIRALRKLPRGFDWHADLPRAHRHSGRPAEFSNRMRERTGASSPRRRSPRRTSWQRLTSRLPPVPEPPRVPDTSRASSPAAPHRSPDLEPYKEGLDDGDLGLMFESATLSRWPTSCSA